MYSFDAIPDGAAVGSDPSARPRETRSTAAGFGSPGADSTVKRIDLNDALIRHPDATFVMRAAGSFGKAVTDVAGIVEAVSEFASRAAESLRLQEGAAGAINVFFTTSPFRQNDRQHSPSVTVPLIRPTSDSRHLVGAAVAAVHRLFRPGFNYVKAGVMLVDLQPAGQQQGELDLFSAVSDAAGERPERDRSALMATMDELNRRFGRSSVHIGSASTTANDTDERSWATRQERRSPRFTTRWDEMPMVRA